MSVDAVKTRINSMTGTSLHTMVLHLKDSSGRLVGVLEDGAKKLGYYGPENGWVLRGEGGRQRQQQQTRRLGARHTVRRLWSWVCSSICSSRPGSSSSSMPRQHAWCVCECHGMLWLCACRWCLHVLDSDSTSLAAQGWLEDVSKVRVAAHTARATPPYHAHSHQPLCLHALCATNVSAVPAPLLHTLSPPPAHHR